MNSLENNIKEKMDSLGTPISEWNIKIFRGILTGLNQAFILTKDQRDSFVERDRRTDKLIRPLLRGRDIKRYETTWKNLWLLNIHNGIPSKGIPPIEINNYPIIKNHLDNFTDKLIKRIDKGITPYNLRSCEYLEDFSDYKLGYGDISKRLEFAIIEPGIYMNNTAYFIQNNPYLFYFYGILNSDLINWYYKSISVQLGSVAVRAFSIYINQLPIPKTQSSEVENISELTKLIHAQNHNEKLIKEIIIEIEDLVNKLYNLSSQEINFLKSI